MVNTKLLQETLDFLVANLDRWDQTHWFTRPTTPEMEDAFGNEKEVVEVDCGTSFCLAGAVCLNNGFTFVAYEDSPTTSSVVPTDLLEKWKNQNYRFEYEESANDQARLLLGLDLSQSEDLFAAPNSMVDLFATAWVFTHGKIKIPGVMPAHVDSQHGHIDEDRDFPATVAARLKGDARDHG